MPVEASLLTALVVGLLLGIKHAMDADHVVAVTTIVSRSGSIMRSVLVGLSWGIGHTLVLFLVGFAVLVFKLSIPDRLTLSMEFAIGAMLVILGVPVIKRVLTKKPHIHIHDHGDDGQLHGHFHYHDDSQSHDHKHLRKPLLVGMLHGMAGSGILTMLVLDTMSSVIQGMAFLVVFGFGSIIGMLVMSGIIGVPFKLSAGFSRSINTWVNVTAGAISIGLGIYIMFQVGFNEGLFQ